MKIPIICGPTGVGKTELSIEVAKRIGAEIISMDSMQIYKYMDIGTAKPSITERNLIPHHMIDIVYPDEEYNVYRYVKDSMEIVKNILKRGKIAIFVGGTGLYADGLTKGIVEVEPDKKIRRKLRKLEEKNPGSLYFMLKDLDPLAAEKIHPNDTKRTIRALEVILKVRQKFSDLQRKIVPAGDFELIILDRDRNELYERINNRVEIMIELGLVEEVKKLLDMGYSPNLNSMKAIGYKETIQFIKGKYSFEKYVHTLKKNSRHYARRQIIWFRRYKDNSHWLNLSEMSLENAVSKVLEIVKNCLFD